MPFPNLPVPQFPNVPQVPGVPPVYRSINDPVTPTPAPISTDGPGVKSLLGPQQWGLYDKDGNPAITARNVVGVDFANEFRISDYPLEQGAFESYNKVSTPYDARVIFTRDGNQSQRASFLAQAEIILNSLDLYSVVTPEFSYQSASVIHYDYRRSAAKGASLITLEVWVREVRITVNQQFTNTATASAADSQSVGTVQPQPLTKKEFAVIQADQQSFAPATPWWKRP